MWYVLYRRVAAHENNTNNNNNDDDDDDKSKNDNDSKIAPVDCWVRQYTVGYTAGRPINDYTGSCCTSAT